MYGSEIKLNDEFNNFVRNFELAYWGPNTAQQQVHSPYDIGWAHLYMIKTVVKFHILQPIVSLRIDYWKYEEMNGFHWDRLFNNTYHFMLGKYKTDCQIVLLN